MNITTVRRIRLVYGIILSLAALVACICLIWACLGIYHSGGEQIYTPEKVQLAFSRIAVPVYICLALVIVGFILDFSLPRDEKKRKPEKNLHATLERLLSKRDLNSCDPTLKAGILHQRNCRFWDSISSGILLAAGSIVFLVYACNPHNFHSTEINTSMIRAFLLLLACLVVPFGFSVFAAYHSKHSLQKEIDLVKQIPGGTTVQPPQNITSVNPLLLIRCLLVCAAVALLVYGFVAGGTADVLTKAKNICTECVGLG